MSGARADPVPWDELSDTARATLLWWIRRAAENSSFRIIVQHHEGGVRSVTEERVIERHEDGSRQIRVRTYHPRELPSGNGAA